jgi:hypothetical protein
VAAAGRVRWDVTGTGGTARSGDHGGEGSLADSALKFYPISPGRSSARPGRVRSPAVCGLHAATQTRRSRRAVLGTWTKTTSDTEVES